MAVMAAAGASEVVCTSGTHNILSCGGGGGGRFCISSSSCGRIYHEGTAAVIIRPSERLRMNNACGERRAVAASSSAQRAASTSSAASCRCGGSSSSIHCGRGHSIGFCRENTASGTEETSRMVARWCQGSLRERRRRRRLGSASDSAVNAAPTGNAAEAASSTSGGGISSGSGSSSNEAEVECVATGINVECFVPDFDSDTETNGIATENSNAKVAKGNGAAAAAAAATAAAGDFVPAAVNDRSAASSNGSAAASNGSAAAGNGSAAAAAAAIGREQKQDDGAASLSATGVVEDSGASSALSLAAVGSALLLISPFFFWGSSMVAMKDVLPRAGPMFVAAFRLIPAGLLLVAFASSRGRPMPSTLNAWLAIALFAAVDATAFQGFLSEGLRRTSAGLGSVIIDSQPLTVAVLAALLFGETITARGVVGLVLGVLGLCLLELPADALAAFSSPQQLLSLLDGLSSGSSGDIDALTSAASGTVAAGTAAAAAAVVAATAAAGSAAGVGDGGWSLWDSGEWWMLLAAQSMAVGTVMVRWVCRNCDPIMATGWHLVLGGLPLLALSLSQQDPAVSGHIGDLTAVDWSLLAYTSVFGSAVSYGVFFYNANKGNLTKLSSLTFLTPAFATLFGYLFLDETLSEQQLVGAAVTLLAIYAVNTQQQQQQQQVDDAKQ